ncbi:Spy/CpxP family protein refolding chaperone [Bacteroides sp.]|uniref:Spy/CpxP family protein refolding chaperone n=1 Tax=Bacteroides sp. TaxID=29523 RepID=UPI0040279749
MKRMFLIMAIAIVTVLQVSAQDKNRQMTAQQRTEQRIKQMDEKLNLTDEQETKIRELYADFNKQKYSREKRKEAMEKLTADISLLLTAEQQAIYKQMMEQAIAEMKKGRRNKVKE